MLDDESGGGRDGGEDDDDGIPMTLLAVHGNYWLYEGVELLNDLLFGTGEAPFPVRCVYFRDAFELKRFFGTEFVVSSLWRINPDIIERVRRENLLIEVQASDI
ncbi:MAG: hypothetical protein KF887_04490 [Paracoccaceae bacterium]|nr:MAG: hypothetical protein KF887_04490 [Paracoccaceae bacterium]